MRVLKTFPRGGFHPPSPQTIFGSSGRVPLPLVAVVPVIQHIGSPPEILVKEGDAVLGNQILARAKGFVSASVHSPIPGRVTSIGEIFLPNRTRSLAITVKLGGRFAEEAREQRDSSWETLSTEELLQLLREKGVVGLGGATFPTDVKVRIPSGKKCDSLIINGAECEPYLASDHFLMLEKAREILLGVKVLLKIINPSNCFFGIEADKMDAVKTIERVISEIGISCRVVPLKVKYPQGAEKNLILAITKQRVPSGKLPLEVGVININVATAFSTYEAVFLDKPVVERLVTVAGGAVHTPKVLWTRLGTPIHTLFEECGGLKKSPSRIVIGGPMMGFTTHQLDTPVTKGTSGVLALTAKEVEHSRRSSCLNCGRCIRVCHAGLSPTTLFKHVKALDYKEIRKERIADCVECGSCAYFCPARIPLVEAMRLGKDYLKNYARESS